MRTRHQENGQSMYHGFIYHDILPQNQKYMQKLLIKEAFSSLWRLIAQIYMKSRNHHWVYPGACIL